MSATALLAGLGLGGVIGWWLGQRFKRTRPSPSPEPVPPPITPTPPDWDLAYQRAIALAGYQASFLANTSHELRSPLNQIISLHQLILADLCDGPEEERLFLAQAQDAITQVLKNLDLLLTISKLEIGRTKPDLQPLQLAAVFTNVETLIKMQAVNRNCRLTLLSPSTDLYVCSDPHWLQQALVLLIEGAIASESSQIQLSSHQPTPGVIGIEIEHDSPPSTWQTPLADQPAQSRPELSQPVELSLLSAPFRLQLATQILAQMQGQASLSESPPSNSPMTAVGGDYTLLTLSVPRAEEEDLSQ